jgi:ergothioneine biosynthesis protein EgtB
MSTLSSSPQIDSVQRQFSAVRQQTLALCEPLTPEDMMVQSCPEASPAKWHLAHTTWFFETFVLREFLPSYRPFHPDFLWLFNSYYNGVSDQPEKKLRSCFSRPTLESVLAYRLYVETAMEALIDFGLPEEAERRIILGLHHEQQHQELLLTDIKHSFWTNPLHPVYQEASAGSPAPAAPLRWIDYPGGVREIGHSGESFAFDNEQPRHSIYLQPFRIASRLATCGEYLEFMQAGGYDNPEYWLSEGWATVQAEQWSAPLYWRSNEEGEWFVFTLRGLLPLAELMETPVGHLSYFEADAYARWRGARLPREEEWETIASKVRPAGNLLDQGHFHPGVAPAVPSSHPQQLFGDVWEWTASAYLGYPGFRALEGALGEYNGKFMCNQMVLRGGSCITPASHIRSTYRNFFPPATRWQFAGLRLAQDQ